RLLVREYEDELAREVTIAVDNALPAALREALGEQRTDAAALAGVDAFERAVSHAASLAMAYLAVGWSVALVARGAEVAAGTGRAHQARVLTALALLPAVGDEVPFTRPPTARGESVLVVP